MNFLAVENQVMKLSMNQKVLYQTQYYKKTLVQSMGKERDKLPNFRQISNYN